MLHRPRRLLVLLVALLAACQSRQQGELMPPSPAARVTTTVSPTGRPGLAGTPGPPQTQTPRPTATVTATPAPPATRPLPADWHLVGQERFGIQMAAPRDWQDLTWMVRASPLLGRFGPRLIFLADVQETGEKLLAGTRLAQGAYVFGFRASAEAASADPATTLMALVNATAGETQAAAEPGAITVYNLPGAYVDLDDDPLDVFSTSDQPWRYRLLVLLQPESRAQVTFLMATGAGQWEATQDAFAAVMESITLPTSNARIFGHIVGGDQVSGALESGSVDVWTFNGEAGRYATITLAPLSSGIDLTLSLVAPSGNVLANMDGGYAGDPEALADILLTESGTYVIEVGEFFNEVGRYQLSLMTADEPQFGGGGRVEFGQEVTAELVENGEDTWLFEGTAGQTVTIIVTSLDPQLDIILELRGPDSRRLEILDEGFAGDAELLAGFELAVTGQYAILVRGFAGRGGAYALLLDEGGESTQNFYDAGDLVYGDSAREILRKDEAHAWFFSGLTGEEVSIEVTPLTANMDMDVWLLDPEARELVMQDALLSGQPETITYTLPVDGQYLILVREFFGEAGEYEISLNVKVEEVLQPAGRLSYGQTVTGTLPAGRQAGWTFAGRAGDLIDVVLRPTSPERDLIIELIDPAGASVAVVDLAVGGLTERLAGFTLTTDGEWLIVVREFFGERSNYELRLIHVEAAAGESAGLVSVTS